jgi:hypothetical protein
MEWNQVSFEVTISSSKKSGSKGIQKNVFARTAFSHFGVKIYVYYCYLLRQNSPKNNIFRNRQLSVSLDRVCQDDR